MVFDFFLSLAESEESDFYSSISGTDVSGSESEGMRNFNPFPTDIILTL